MPRFAPHETRSRSEEPRDEELKSCLVSG
jgi:hypothetical protein